MNIANKLTLLRILLIPVFIVFVLLDQYGATNLYQWLALVVFVAASLTDFLDGHLARKYNVITDFGKFLDPLADKLLTCAAFCAMIGNGQMSVWALFIVIAREFAVTGFRLVAAGSGVVIAAGIWGKCKTVLQMAVVILALLPLDIGLDTIVWRVSVLDILIFIMVAVTLLSGAEYIVKNRNLIKTK